MLRDRMSLVVFALWVTALAAGVPTASAIQVPKATCQPSDKVETGLQGQIPWPDRVSGRAAEGYNCNLVEVGKFESRSWLSMDEYKSCVYFGDSVYGSDTGTVVLDVSDPRNPKKTGYLTTPGMTNTHEGMRVNAKRGLLVGGNPDRSDLDVYDVKSDCTHPKLLSSTQMPEGSTAHEGFFAPDGQTFYAANYSVQVTPIDMADPTHPKPLLECADLWCQIHGGSVSLDGTRGYFAETNNQSGSTDGLAVVDLTDVQQRKRNAEIKPISLLRFPWNAANQSTYPLFYGKHPWIVSFGELSKNSAVESSISPHCPSAVETNFDFPRLIDIADEKHPKLDDSGKLLNEVDNPLNCPLVVADNGPVATNETSLLLTALFTYDAHYCSVDRLHDPTLLACAQIQSGMRVYDIRDPHNVKEIAYFNPGTVSATDTTVDSVAEGPIIRRDLGQIWFISGASGFHVVEFENGVWPFKDSPYCPSEYDYLQAQYDMTYEERCAPKPPAAATPKVKGRGRARGLTLKARRRGRTLTVSGVLRLPTGLSPAVCRGGVVRISAGAKARRAKLNRKCRYRATLKLRKAKRVKVRARFAGTAGLAPIKARALRA